MSNWDGSERRQNISNEIALFDRRISLLEENQNKIGELQTNLAVLTESVDNIKKVVCEKLDRYAEEITVINTRCLEREEIYVLAQKHLKDEETLRSIWSDRRFKVLFWMFTSAFGSMFGLFFMLLKSAVK